MERTKKKLSTSMAPVVLIVSIIYLRRQAPVLSIFEGRLPHIPACMYCCNRFGLTIASPIATVAAQHDKCPRTGLALSAKLGFDIRPRGCATLSPITWVIHTLCLLQQSSSTSSVAVGCLLLLSVESTATYYSGFGLSG